MHWIRYTSFQIAYLKVSSYHLNVIPLYAVSFNHLQQAVSCVVKN